MDSQRIPAPSVFPPPSRGALPTDTSSLSSLPFSSSSSSLSNPLSSEASSLSCFSANPSWRDLPSTGVNSSAFCSSSVSSSSVSSSSLSSSSLSSSSLSSSSLSSSSLPSSSLPSSLPFAAGPCDLPFPSSSLAPPSVSSRSAYSFGCPSSRSSSLARPSRAPPLPSSLSSSTLCSYERMSGEIWRRIEDVKLLLPCRANGSSESRAASAAAAALEEKMVKLERTVADIQKQVAAELVLLPALPALLASAHAQRQKIQQLQALFPSSLTPFSSFGAKGDWTGSAVSRPRGEKARREGEKGPAPGRNASVDGSARKERKISRDDKGRGRKTSERKDATLGRVGEDQEEAMKEEGEETENAADLLEAESPVK